MELAFSTQQLRSICEDPSVAKRSLGAELTEVLIDRLADLRAADSFAELLVPPTAQPPGSETRFNLALSERANLVIAANHPRSHWSTQEGVDLSRLWRVRIEAIEVAS